MIHVLQVLVKDFKSAAINNSKEKKDEIDKLDKNLERFSRVGFHKK